MNSRVAGGVSIPIVEKDTPSTLPAFILIAVLERARQFDSEISCTEVCEVVVNDDFTRVVVPATESGVNGSRLIASTTKTSLSSGDKFKSTLDCVNVFAAVSVALNPIATTLEVCLRPLTIPSPILHGL